MAGRLTERGRQYLNRVASGPPVWNQVTQLTMRFRLLGNHALGMPCPNRITLPTTDYLSGSDAVERHCQDVPARRNGLSGIKTRLNSDSNHAGPMEEKSKTSGEHFYNYLFTIKRGKACGTRKRFFGCVTQEKMREVWCDNYASNL